MKKNYTTYEYLGIVFNLNVKCDFFRKTNKQSSIYVNCNLNNAKVKEKSENLYMDGIYKFSIPNYITYEITKEKIDCYCKKIDFFYYTICNIPFSILSILNNKLPLHCSAIYTNKMVFTFIGHKGIGKSTLCLKLLLSNNNYFLYGDDAISLGIENNKIFAYSGIKYLKLNEDIVKCLNLDCDETQKISKEFDKFFYKGINSAPKNKTNNFKLLQLVNKECSTYNLNDLNSVYFYIKKNVLSLETIYPNLYRKINELLLNIASKISEFLVVSYLNNEEKNIKFLLNNWRKTYD